MSEQTHPVAEAYTKFLAVHEEVSSRSLGDGLDQTAAANEALSDSFMYIVNAANQMHIDGSDAARPETIIHSIQPSPFHTLSGMELVRTVVAGLKTYFSLRPGELVYDRQLVHVLATPAPIEKVSVALYGKNNVLIEIACRVVSASKVIVTERSYIGKVAIKNALDIYLHDYEDDDNPLPWDNIRDIARSYAAIGEEEKADELARTAAERARAYAIKQMSVARDMPFKLKKLTESLSYLRTLSDLSHLKKVEDYWAEVQNQQVSPEVTAIRDRLSTLFDSQ